MSATSMRTTSPTRSLGKKRWLSSLGMSAACLLTITPAAAQSVTPLLTEGLLLPSQNVASTDDSSAVTLNPANIAFMRGAEARFAWTYTGEDALLPIRGLSLGAAGSFWILGTGLELNWMIPPTNAPAPYVLNGEGQSLGWVKWATAARLGRFAALGTTLAWSHGENPDLHGHFGVTSGLTVRPHNTVSLAAVANNWASVRNDAALTLDRSFDFAAAVRPIYGHRRFELGGGLRYDPTTDRVAPKATLSADVPWVGRVHAGARMVDTSSMHIVANAAVDMNIDRLMLRAGGLFGPGLSSTSGAFHASATLRTHRESTGVALPPRVVRLKFESTPNVRQHTRVLRRMWALADQNEVSAVVLQIRATPAPSLPHAEEMVDAIKLLRRRGKKVMCHLEDATGRTLFVCSAANRIAMNPAGGLRFAGVTSRRLYLGGLLNHLGIDADFVRIGAHKLAPEQFADGPSQVGIEDRRHILRRVEAVYIDQIARGRKLSREKLSTIIAEGPYLAKEAKAKGLIDQLVFEDELNRYVEEVIGAPPRIRDDKIVPVKPDRWRDEPRVAVVYLHGMMVDGKSRVIPGLGLRFAGSRTVSKALERARKDKNVKAIVLRVETGGGSSVASDVILREAQLCARTKPLIVSMGGSAASGGYYASVAGHKILANRSTLTGSIGIFYGKVDISRMLSKLGIQSHAIRSAPRSDAESIYRPFTEDERRTLGIKVKQIYDIFVGRVAEGRSLSVAKVDSLARGRVWTGLGASTRGLVDEVGGFRQALRLAQRLGGLPSDSPVVELPLERPSLLMKLLKLGGLSIPTEQIWLPPSVRQAATALAPFLIFESHQPLAVSDVLVPAP